MNGQYIYGDLNNQTIKDIWANTDFESLRKNFLSKNINELPKICQSCDYPKKGQWSLPFFWEKKL